MENDIIRLDEQVDFSNIINFQKSISGTTDSEYGKEVEANCQHTLLIGNSLYNEYIPFIAPFIGQSNKIGDISFLLYDLMYNKNNYASTYKGITRSRRTGIRRVRDPITGRLVQSQASINRFVQVVNIDPTDTMFNIVKLNYADILYALSTYLIPRVFENEQFMFQVGKGIMFEYDDETKECDLLLILGIKSSYYLQAKKDSIEGKLNPNNFALFISNEFSSEEKYKLVYKKIEKEYINLAIDAGIDVVYTNSIENRLYKNGSEKPKFKTIVEMNQFLDKINNNIHQYLKVD